MKKQFLLASLAAMAATPSFSAGFKPFIKGESTTPTRHVSVRAASKAPVSPQTVVDEDFSRLTQGSEENPVLINLDGYYIPDNLTAQPGWTGKAVAEANGAIAILSYEDEYYGETNGYIHTPRMYLYGEVTISFRAKTIGSQSGNMWVPLCDDYDGPVDELDCELTDEWQEFTFTSFESTPYYNNYFQFSPEDCKVLIDDLKIAVTHNKVVEPSALPATNLSLTAFRAEWESVADPESYVFNVYSKEKPEHFEEGSIYQNFDSINIIDGTTSIDNENPNYPEGWEISVSNAGNNDVCTDPGSYNSSPLAINLDAVGDRIVSCETPLPIRSLEFWIKPSTIEQESYDYSLIQVSVFSNKWSAIANLPNYWLEEDGMFYSFDAKAIGEGVTKVKIEYLQKGEKSVSFAIDDICLEYETADVRVPFIEDLEISGEINSYEVDGIDPEKNYYYFVKAKSGDLMSVDSYHIWVDGLTGLTPVALDATDVTANSFTARWEAMPHATDYAVKVSRLTKAEKDMEDVTVIEENFDKINNGTVDNPGYDFVSPFNFGDNNMANSSWMATQPRWANGMAGSAGTSWYGSAGLVASPRLTLSNNGGAFDVEFTAYNTQPDDVIFCMILNELTDQQALDSRNLQMGSQPGLVSGKVHFDESDENRSDVIIAFMSMSGLTFFIDDVRISQNLKAGESLVSDQTSVVTSGTSYNFSSLPEGSSYSYYVTASASKDYTDYATNRSNIITVDNILSGIDKIDDAGIHVNVNGSRITVSGVETGANIRLFDIQGRLHTGITSIGKECVLNASSGVYLLEIDGKTMKIIVR